MNLDRGIAFLVGGSILCSAASWASTGVRSGQTNSSFISDIPSELASPWTTKARSWLLAGAGLTAGILLLEDQTDDPVQRAFVRHKPLGTGWAKIGDYGGRLIPNGAYIGGMLIDYLFLNNPTALTRAQLMTKATLYSAAASTLIKFTVREPRPYDGHVRTSFPSGHSTTAFAFTSFVTAEHGFFPAGILATGLATLTAVSRINDNKHYLHDVVAGATIGTAYGLGVYYLESKPSSSEQRVVANFSVIPIYDAGIKGIDLDMNF